jgi:hypothetical protein
LPERRLEIIAYDAKNMPVWSGEYGIFFTGGDSWQRTLMIAPDARAGAERLECRLLDPDDQVVSERQLQLSAPGPIKGLEANGNLLMLKDDVLVFNLRRPQKKPLVANRKSATVVFTAELVPRWMSREYTTSERVSINASDSRLGLEKPIGSYVRRTPAEWVVAAANAAGSRNFDRALIEVTPSLSEVGVALSDMRHFLSGIIMLLRSRDGLEVEIDLETLHATADTPRERALLAACREIAFQLEGTDGDNKPTEKKESQDQ